MSVYSNLFVGPYAEWLVRTSKRLPPFLNSPLDQSLIEGMKLYWPDELPDVRRGGVRYHRYVFMPREARPEMPSRPLYFSGKGGPDNIGIQDLTEVDTRGEIDWFLRAFREELQALAEHFGGPPSLRWGLVHWLT
jgi:hypothetical protein